MKLFTLILATASFLTISSTSFSQTGFIGLENKESNNINMLTSASSIKFNPDGIAKGILKVKMYNQPEGVYTMQLIDADGQVLAVKEIHHSTNTKIEVVDFAKNFPGGTYQVAAINPYNKKTDETIMLLL